MQLYQNQYYEKVYLGSLIHLNPSQLYDKANLRPPGTHINFFGYVNSVVVMAVQSPLVIKMRWVRFLQPSTPFCHEIIYQYQEFH